jgi:imidazoleglycerol phosphate synthase glutamine amidotransferase subunit HisH
MKKKKKKIPQVGYGPFDFVNVALGAAEGRISMGDWFQYVHSFGSRPMKKKKISDVKRRQSKSQRHRLPDR